MSEKDILICGPRAYFPDDLRGKCADCKKDIVYRSHAPKNVIRVCMVCAAKLIKKDPRPMFKITEATREEIKEFIDGM